MTMGPITNGAKRVTGIMKTGQRTRIYVVRKLKLSRVVDRI